MIPKCTTTIRMLAFGIAIDAMDEYVCMGKNTTMKDLKAFLPND
jgi:hypothetical protein